jgi:hypothetical protein
MGTPQASKQVNIDGVHVTQKKTETPDSLLFLLCLRILNYFPEEVARRAFLLG